SVWTATAHVVTVIIGSGVLAIPWSAAQLGWILAFSVLLFFSFAAYYNSTLLADCYRHPGPLEGRRNRTYMDAIWWFLFLGEKTVTMCGIVQYIILWGSLVGYTLTAAMSVKQIRTTACLHVKGKNAPCQNSGMLSLLIFDGMQIVLSQLPNLANVAILSYIAAAMSFTYSFIGLYLCIRVFASQHEIRGSLFVGSDSASSITIWHTFQALGNIAFAYTFSMILIEIQDTLKSPPPENKTMKKAAFYGIGLTTLFYISLGFVGYAAFGSAAPGNVITGFTEPFWLIEVGNTAVVVHLVGAYQVYGQPAFASCESLCAAKWPNSGFFHSVHKLRLPFAKDKFFEFTFARVVLRTIFVCLTTLVAATIPFFNSVLGLLGSIAFWPLTVYYPVSMHVAQAEVKRWSIKWVSLMAMTWTCLLVAVLGAAGSIVEITKQMDHAKLFHIQ
ncbi:hypothetical protein Taro_007328, partial [Colocasia esculenta]|nr:hypothetical protein [Colocasia esculenta]